MIQDSREGAPANTPPRAAHAWFLALWLFSVAVFWGPLRQMIALSLSNDWYSHLIVIPLISAGLIYWDRVAIFRRPSRRLRAGIPLALGFAICGLALQMALRPASDYVISFVILAVALTWAAIFLLCYGAASLKVARFPILFLALMVPVPSPVMAKVVFALQTGSSELVLRMFQLADVPLYHQGFTFELPGIGIEVAKECSSIHSFWALLITSLILGHFLLTSLRAKASLSLLTIPTAVFTNGVRIVTIWYLATHVDPGFMYGHLHRDGGILFSLISLSILLSAIWVLQKLESRHASAPGARGPMDANGLEAKALRG